MLPRPAHPRGCQTPTVTSRLRPLRPRPSPGVPCPKQLSLLTHCCSRKFVFLEGSHVLSSPKERELALDMAKRESLLRRFRCKQGIGFEPFALTVSLCDSIAHGGIEVRNAIAKFKASGADRKRVFKFIKDLFFLLVDKETASVSCTCRRRETVAHPLLD